VAFSCRSRCCSAAVSRAVKGLWLFLGLIAVIGNLLPFSLVTWGQRGIDSGLAGILMAVMPLATLGLAHLFVPGERLTGNRWSGF
jgi:drug/metabolite transporter (DMT)-like permease